MPPSTRSVAALENLISSRATPFSFGIIGIDGTDGAGKSILAQELASRLNANLLELDSIVENNAGAYVDCVDYSALSSKILCRKAQSALLIVEGICLLAVLERIVMEPSLLIYVKRINHCGYWYDEYYCKPQENPAAGIEELRRMFVPVNGEASSEEDKLFFEIVHYHQFYKPTEKADVFFERVIPE